MATRTRPDIKWLINEAAMLKGELERIDQEMARLEEHRKDVEKARAACERALAYVVQQAVGGLPTVHAHRSYGKRGDLQRFLAATLKAAAPAQFRTTELADLALAHFDLRMSSPAELYYFHNNTVGRALRRLLALGLIERLTTKHRVERALGTWRWKTEVATLGQLERLAAGGVAEAAGAGAREAADASEGARGELPWH
jgi:hypothetical protein